MLGAYNKGGYRQASGKTIVIFDYLIKCDTLNRKHRWLYPSKRPKPSEQIITCFKSWFNALCIQLISMLLQQRDSVLRDTMFLRYSTKCQRSCERYNLSVYGVKYSNCSNLNENGLKLFSLIWQVIKRSAGYLQGHLVAVSVGYRSFLEQSFNCILPEPQPRESITWSKLRPISFKSERLYFTYFTNSLIYYFHILDHGVIDMFYFSYLFFIFQLYQCQGSLFTLFHRSLLRLSHFSSSFVYIIIILLLLQFLYSHVLSYTGQGVPPKVLQCQY